MSNILTLTVRHTDNASISFRESQILPSVCDQVIPGSLPDVLYRLAQVWRFLCYSDAYKIFQSRMKFDERRI
jgi:hypothetical protein